MKIEKRKIALIAIVLLVLVGFGASVAIAGPERLASLQDAARGDWADITAPFAYRAMPYEATIALKDGDRLRVKVAVSEMTGAIGVSYRSNAPFMVNDSDAVSPPIIGENYSFSYLLPGMNITVEDEIRARDVVTVTFYMPTEGVEVRAAVNIAASETLYEHSGMIKMTFGSQQVTAISEREGFEKTFLLTPNIAAKIKHAVKTAPKSPTLWIVYQEYAPKAIYSFYEVIWSR